MTEYQTKGQNYNPDAPPPYPAQAAGGYPGAQAVPYPNQQTYPTQQVYVTQPQVGLAFGATVNQGPPPPDYFSAAIVATICCFWPTGIFAIMKASDCRAAIARGDMDAARRHSQDAKRMFYITLGVGICLFILIIVIIGVWVGLVVSHRRY